MLCGTSLKAPWSNRTCPFKPLFPLRLPLPSAGARASRDIGIFLWRLPAADYRSVCAYHIVDRDLTRWQHHYRTPDSQEETLSLHKNRKCLNSLLGELGLSRTESMAKGLD